MSMYFFQEPLTLQYHIVPDQFRPSTGMSSPGICCRPFCFLQFRFVYRPKECAYIICVDFESSHRNFMLRSVCAISRKIKLCNISTLPAPIHYNTYSKPKLGPYHWYHTVHEWNVRLGINVYLALNQSLYAFADQTVSSCMANWISCDSATLLFSRQQDFYVVMKTTHLTSGPIITGEPSVPKHSC